MQSTISTFWSLQVPYIGEPASLYLSRRDRGESAALVNVPIEARPAIHDGEGEPASSRSLLRLSTREAREKSNLLLLF